MQNGFKDFFHSSRYRYFLLAIAIMLSTLPPLFGQLTGDMSFQYTLISCFSEQFWQGNLYPRWCFQANDGLGAPVFLFYYPAAFFIAAVFYPLVWMGMDIYSYYIFLLLLATVVTSVFASIYFNVVIGKPYAVIATTLYLLLPYRAEVMYYRVAFAETWALAILPLFFFYVRRLALKQSAVAGCTASLALLMLTHMPLAIIAGGFGLLYLLCMRASLGVYVLIALAATAITAFYTLPAFFYFPYTQYNVLMEKGIWANSQLSMNMILLGPRLEIAVTAVIVLALLAVLLIYISRYAQRAASSVQKKEISALCALYFFSAFLFFPLSKPLLEWTRPFSSLVLPWRVQAVSMLCFAYAAALCVKYFLPERRLKSLGVDCVLMLLGVASVSALNIQLAHGVYAQTVYDEYALRQLSWHEYQTIWTDNEQLKFQSIAEHAKHPPARAAYIKGAGKIEILRWDWRGIILNVSGSENGTIRIDHRYFPTWQAHTKTGNILSLHPENRTGIMLVDVPTGNMEIHITHSVWPTARADGIRRWF